MKWKLREKSRISFAADWQVNMEELYKKYIHEGFDENGVLNQFDIHCPESFNFAYDIVDEIARQEPDRRAMVWTNVAGEERTFTFGEISRLSNQAANVFSAHGIKKGDKVMLILKRHYQFWPIILALHKLGAVAIPATNLLTTKDIVFRVQAATIDAVVVTSEGKVADYVSEAKADCPELKHIFTVKADKPGFINFDTEMENAPTTFSRVPTSTDDSMLLYFTSGTTGYPKMVVHDYSYPLAHVMTAKYWQNVDPNGLHLTVSETGWAKAVWGKLYGQWILGAGIFVYDFDHFVPQDLLKMIEKYQLTTFCAPPTIYRFFIKEGLGDYDLSSLQYATIAGEALNFEVYKQFLDKTGLKLMEGFGQTETTLTVANLVGNPVKPGSMGRPTPLYNIDLVDENLVSVEPGRVGEVVLRPRDDETLFGVFRGYYRDADLTSEVWRGGVYHTGDTAYMDEDGFFWYVGRTDDIIKSSGYRIGPFEIESVLMEHPAVLECAVTGVPDEVRGQVVKATIVLTSQYSPSDELAKEIQTHVKKSTAPYKYPRVIEFVDELPKTISGKIRRIEIRENDKQ